jgi:3-oxoacyl-[acyl-carrier protein] reductase
VTAAFSGMADRSGSTADEWLEGLAGEGTLLGRLPTARDVAECAAFLVSDRAAVTTGAIANLSAGAIVD